MRSKHWSTWATCLLLAVAGVAGWLHLHPPTAIHAATTTVAPGSSFLIILGVGDTAGTNWDGSLTVTGASVEIIRGWRFEGTDAINGNSWKLSTRAVANLNGPGPV